MKRLLILLMFATTGCSTVVPVVAKFPDAPTSLEVPGKLTTMDPSSTKMSVLLKNANKNYRSYYLLRENHIIWLEWYDQQKTIFEEVNKQKRK